MAANNTVPVEAGNYYHIYNHANGNDNVFFLERNYDYFFKKYENYIHPIADTFAYCLMPNHFHFLLRFKEEKEIFDWLKEKNKINQDQKGFKNLSGLENLKGFKNLSGLENPFSNIISKQFSDYLNGYAKAINKQQNRMGSLFMRPFKRKKITSEKQLRDTLIYIHNNPVHHGFTESAALWKHSSYHSLLSDKPTILLRDEVVNWFMDKENLVYCHNKHSDALIEI